MKRAFQRAAIGGRLEVVNDGEEVVSYLKGESPYDNRKTHPIPLLLLLDLKMPRRNGLEVLAWIRSQSGHVKRLPVVILTSSKQTSDVNRAYDLGANSYLVKPTNFEKLVEMVRNLETYWMAFSQKPELVLP